MQERILPKKCRGPDEPRAKDNSTHGERMREEDGGSSRDCDGVAREGEISWFVSARWVKVAGEPVFGSTWIEQVFERKYLLQCVSCRRGLMDDYLHGWMLGHRIWTSFPIAARSMQVRWFLLNSDIASFTDTILDPGHTCLWCWKKEK